MLVVARAQPLLGCSVGPQCVPLTLILVAAQLLHCLVAALDPSNRECVAWQAYLLPLCWKLDDHSCTELRFVDRQCTLASLLAATASYVPAGFQPNIANDPSDDVIKR